MLLLLLLLQEAASAGGWSRSRISSRAAERVLPNTHLAESRIGMS